MFVTDNLIITVTQSYRDYIKYKLNYNYCCYYAVV